MSFSSRLPERRLREIAQVGGGEREAADDFSSGVFTVEKAPERVHEHPHVRLPRFAPPLP